MTYRGRVKNGVVVFTPPTNLPEGAEVEVSPIPSENTEPTWGEVFQDLEGKAAGLPTDLAQNHDHYLHGAPKK